MSRRGDYASGLFQAYFLFLSLFSPFITKLLKGAIFRPKIFFTKLLLPPQKCGALGGRLVRLVVKPALGVFPLTSYCLLLMQRSWRLFYQNFVFGQKRS